MLPSPTHAASVSSRRDHGNIQTIMHAHRQPLSSICAALVLALLVGCASTPAPILPSTRPGAEAATPEQLVAKVMNRLADDIAHRRTPRVLGAISDAYKDDGGRDFPAVKAYIEEQFRNYSMIAVKRITPKITIQGNEARVVETLGIRGEPENVQKVAPISFEGTIAVTLREVQGVWLITKVQWL